MIRLALVGDDAIAQYSVAGRLWELLSVIIDKKYKYEVLPISTADAADDVFTRFKHDENFIGFSIAPRSWEQQYMRQVDVLESPSQTQISVIYRNADGHIIGGDVYPLATQRAVEASMNLYKCTSVLIIGAQAGMAIAQHFRDELDKDVAIFDPAFSGPAPEGVTVHTTLRAVRAQTYDLVMNATPLGRQYTHQAPEAFTSPLDLETLQAITHAGTVIHETNYIPQATLLVQMARHLDLPVITGEKALVFGTLECLRRFFGVTLDENTVQMLLDEINEYIFDREQEVGSRW
jgi:shikimate 5-dehydrogenase